MPKLKLLCTAAVCASLVASTALADGMVGRGAYNDVPKRSAAAPVYAETNTPVAPLVGGGTVTLADTVRMAIGYSPNLKEYQEYRQAAEFDLKRSRSGWLPKLDARAGYGIEQWNDAVARTVRSPRGENTWYDRFDGTLVARQTIWDGLATLGRYRFSEARLKSAAERLYDNSEAVTLDAILSHIEIFRQRKLVALSELNVQNHRSILASQEARQRGGAASLADVTLTQGRLARSEASLAEARLALAKATAQYKMLTGREPMDLAAPDIPMNAYPSLESAIASTQTTNSKVRALVADVDANIAQKDIDKANFHPLIYVEAATQYQWYVTGSSTYTWGNYAQVKGEWNLYNGHYDWYNLKANKAKVRQSKYAVDSLKDQLAADATGTWNDQMTAREISRYYTNAVMHNTQTRDMYLEQFNIGQRSLLDVLDSENELYNSSMLLVSSQLNEVASQYRLKALGGELLSSFGIEKSNLAIKTDEPDFTNNDHDADPYPANGKYSYDPYVKPIVVTPATPNQN